MAVVVAIPLTNPTLFDQPAARSTDPVTSVEAAESVVEVNALLVDVIRAVVLAGAPITAFEISDRVRDVWGDRWSDATIRSCCARAGLREAGEGRSPRGRRCLRWSL